jgi:hypothetical protein
LNEIQLQCCLHGKWKGGKENIFCVVKGVSERDIERGSKGRGRRREYRGVERNVEVERNIKGEREWNKTETCKETCTGNPYRVTYERTWVNGEREREREREINIELNDYSYHKRRLTLIPPSLTWSGFSLRVRGCW